MGSTHYKIDIESSSGNKLIADEPVSAGGEDSGFSPKELLIASLAACTSATLRMYADKKEWDLRTIDIDIDLTTDESGSLTTIIRKLKLTGELNEEQKNRLLNIANKCPVHKILSNPISIKTSMH
jgi:putative redox protein